MKVPKLLKILADAILAVQPLFAVPVYFSVLAGAPPLWLSLVIAIVPLGLRFWLKRRFLDRTPFDVPILIFIAGSLVGLLVSPNKEVAVGALASTLASILVFYGMVNNGQRGNRYWLSVGGVICAITLIMTSWFFSEGTARHVSFNGWAFALFKGLPKTGGPVLQFNSLGALLAVVIPGLWGMALFNGRSGLRAGSSILAVVFTVALVLTTSGGGWMAAACGLAFVLVCWQWRSVLALAPTYGVVGWAGAAFYHRVGWISATFSTGSLLGRFTMWKNTLRMFDVQSSMTGLGLGSWSEAYRLRYGEVQTHVHNSYLQQYADAGILGVAALIAAIVQFVRISRDSLLSSRQDPWYGVAVGLMGGIIAGAVMALYDVTTTVTVMSATSYLYMSVPFLWVWAALLVVAQRKLGAR